MPATPALPFSRHSRRALALVLPLSLSLALSACIGAQPRNRLLDSIHQPVVHHTVYTLDLQSGPNGLGMAELQRLSGWFAALKLRYGDTVAVDDPVANHATRASITSVLTRYGLPLAEKAPVTEGYVPTGSVRVVITRAEAEVPHCPDWSANSETNFKNATSSNYGCAVNGNLAAMVANPDDLLHGASNAGETTQVSGDKAINAYRTSAPSGGGGKNVKASATSGGGS